MNYNNKYLKYKNKYMQLINQQGNTKNGKCIIENIHSTKDLSITVHQEQQVKLLNLNKTKM